jgi:hypothetical protein
MTVSELIDILQQMEPSAPVWVDDNNINKDYCAITSVDRSIDTDGAIIYISKEGIDY